MLCIRDGVPFDLKIILSFMIVAGLSVVAIARPRYEKIAVKDPLKTELNSVLRAASDLQQASVSGGDKKVEIAVNTLIGRLQKAKQTTGDVANQRQHLNKMLDAAKSSLINSRQKASQTRRESLKNAFSQIVMIAQVYKLDSYKIYFCPKDRSVWLQKSGKPLNPVSPDKFKDCGRPVQ